MTGESITLKGHFFGNVQVYASELLIAPSAIIDGDLSYLVEKIEISPQAKIFGEKLVLSKVDHDMGKRSRFFIVFASFSFRVRLKFLSNNSEPSASPDSLMKPFILVVFPF